MRRTLGRITLCLLISGLCYALGAMTLAASIAGADTTPSCTATITGLPTTTPGTPEYTTYINSGGVNFITGVTDASLSCSNVPTGYTALDYIADIDGTSYDFYVQDADWSLTDGPTYASLDSSFSVDGTATTWPTDDSTPSAPWQLNIATDNNGDDPETFASSGDQDTQALDTISDGDIIGWNGTGGDYSTVIAGPDAGETNDPSEETTTTTSTTTTTEPPAELIADTASAESPGIIALAAGLIALAVVALCVRMVFRAIRERRI